LGILCPSCEFQPSQLDRTPGGGARRIVRPAGEQTRVLTNGLGFRGRVSQGRVGGKRCGRRDPVDVLEAGPLPTSGSKFFALRGVTTLWTVDIPASAGEGSTRMAYRKGLCGKSGFERTFFDRNDPRRALPKKRASFSSVGRIVICATFGPFVSPCGPCGALLLASSHCYVAHFNCEQELNSTCSRSFLDQRTRCIRDALLSNARLTFAPLRVFRHSPPAQSRAPLPSFHCGERSIRAAMTAIHIEVSIHVSCIRIRPHLRP
jgi:hypothetical protein